MNHIVGSDQKTWSALVRWVEQGIEYVDGVGELVEYDGTNLAPLRDLVGDETVPLASALGGQQWGEDYYFWRDTKHGELPANGEAGRAIEAAAWAGSIDESDFGNLSPTPYGVQMNRTLYIEWRTIYPRPEQLAGSDGFPVVLELLEIDPSTGESVLLAGDVLMEQSGDREYEYLALSDRASLFQGGRQ